MTQRRGRLFVPCLLSLACALAVAPRIEAQWVIGQKAQYVVGESNFSSRNNGVSSTVLGSLGSHAVAIDHAHGKMYLSDPINHRVVRFNYPVTGNEPAADLAFGQISLDSNTAFLYATASTLNRPWGLDVWNGDLWVVDRADGRLLRYPQAWNDNTNDPPADLVLGQPDFFTVNSGVTDTQMIQPRGMCFDAAGNLWVADGNNNRVLEFADASNKANGAPADKVLGQADFTHALAISPPSSSTMILPYGVCFEGTTLWVAEGSNNRVLRFDNAASKANGAPANGVLGQPDFVTGTANPNPTAATTATPTDVVTDGNGTLYVCDYSNNRVLIFYNARAKSNGANADAVLGQANFNGSSEGTSDSTMGLPNGIQVDNDLRKLLVCDEYNYRVLQYSAASALPIQLASLAATATGSGVSLTWRTLSEVNSYGFEIQRSVSPSASQWSDAGFVAGGGTTTAERIYTFTDPAGTASSVYRLKHIDLDGSAQFSSPVPVTGAPAQDAAHTATFFLSQNYPNPFNPSTQITYGLPSPGVVSLAVFDILGRQVATLASGYQPAGTHTAHWDATRSASGVYVARIRVTGGNAGAYANSIRLLLTK